MEGKAKTPAEKAEQMRPRRSASDEEAQRPPAESEALHGNQQRCNERFILDRLPFCSCVDGIDLFMSQLLFFDIISGEICRGVLSLFP